jgi:hypothetical protein
MVSRAFILHLLLIFHLLSSSSPTNLHRVFQPMPSFWTPVLANQRTTLSTQWSLIGVSPLLSKWPFALEATNI